MKISSVELNSGGTVMRVIASVALLLLMALAAAGQRRERAGTGAALRGVEKTRLGRGGAI